MAAFGIAGIAYIEHWSHLIALRKSDLFWMKSPPSPIRYAGTVFNTALLGIFVYLVIRAARRHRTNRLVSCAPLGAIAVVIMNSMRDYGSSYYPNLFGGNLLRTISTRQISLGFVLLVPLMLLSLKTFSSSLVPIIRRVLIVFSIFTLLNMGQALYQIRGDTQLSDSPHASFLKTLPGTSPKVVWLVFDELDYRLLFVNRKQGLSLPVLDDFRRTAIVGSHAYPPSSATSVSMLTYLLGEKVVRIEPTGRDSLFVSTAEHPERQDWKQLPNLFSRAREAGVNGAVVGWYLPYDRLLASATVDSWWFEMSTRDAVIGDSLPEMLLNGPRTLLETSLLSPFGQSLLVKRRALLFKQYMEKTRQLLGDARIGLLLLHVPVPHTPYFYDRQTGHDSLSNSMISGYWDALALVDRVLGDLRAQMEQSGEWDTSAILISSDHYYRTAVGLDGRSDHRVPFLLKMPKQHRAFPFDKPFNTQLSHKMILDIVRGKVRTDDEAMTWLEKSYSGIPVGWGVY